MPIGTQEFRYQTTYPTAYPKINKEEFIELEDGTNANYVEIHWKFQVRGMLKTVGVFAYKNHKIIGVLAGGSEETPIGYLAGVAKSLKFTN